jgi:hypothetical protein
MHVSYDKQNIYEKQQSQKLSLATDILQLKYGT